MSTPYSTPGALEKDLKVFLDEQKRRNESGVLIYKNEFMLGTTIVAEFRRLLEARISVKTGKLFSLPQDLVRAGVVLRINGVSKAVWLLLADQDSQQKTSVLDVK